MKQNKDDKNAVTVHNTQFFYFCLFYDLQNSEYDDSRFCGFLTSSRSEQVLELLYQRRIECDMASTIWGIFAVTAVNNFLHRYCSSNDIGTFKSPKFMIQSF